MGKINSRNKGHNFERLIAQEMRMVFDKSDVLEAITSAKSGAQRSEAMKRSRVRRGRQGEGAHESDVVVDGTRLWIECQHAARANHDPVAKLLQAERNCESLGKRLWLPIAVTHCTGEIKRGNRCTMRAWTLLCLMGRGANLKLAGAMMIVELALEDVLTLLRTAPIQ